MRELFRRSGMENKLVLRTTVVVWQIVLDGMRVAIDHRTFSAVLWQAAAAQDGCNLSTLKPKFMLRQFVDEMPDCEERGVIRALAYGHTETELSHDQEVLRLLSSGYEILHAQIGLHIRDLEILTDGLLSVEVIQQFKSPYVQYDEWLFCA